MTDHEDDDRAPSRRQHLPPKRFGWVQKCRVGTAKLYLIVAEYPDGRPGEIFVTVAKTGELVQAMLSGWAMEFSALLQYGVPLADLVQSFRGTRFDPSGPVVDDESVKMASSLFDYVVRHLEAAYAPGAPSLPAKVAAYHQRMPAVATSLSEPAPTANTIHGEWVRTGQPETPAPLPSGAADPLTRLRMLAQAEANKHGEPFLAILVPPASSITQHRSRIGYAVRESMADDVERKAKHERFEPLKGTP
jgi:hypothetical protein